MGDPEPHPLHRLDDCRGWCGTPGRNLDDMLEAALDHLGGVHQQVQHDRRAAEMGDPVLGDRREDRRRIDPPQADMGAGDSGYRPGIGPAVAVKHRQGPQIDRMAIEPEGDRVADRIQKGAAVVVDHTLGVAGGARGIVQRNRLPLVARQRPCRRGVAFGEKCFVCGTSERRAARGVADLDQRHWATEFRECRFDDRCEFAVGNQQLCFTVGQDEGDRTGIEAIVERIQHRSRHRHAEMRFEQRRNVRRHHRDGFPMPNAAPAQRIGEPSATGIKIAVGKPGGAVDDGDLLGVDRGRARQKRERRQCRKICRVLRKVRRVVAIAW